MLRLFKGGVDEKESEWLNEELFSNGIRGAKCDEQVQKQMRDQI